MTCYVWCNVMHTCCITCAPHLVLAVDIGPSIQKSLNCLCMSILSSFHQGSRMSALHGRVHGEEGEGKCVEAAHITTCTQ